MFGEPGGISYGTNGKGGRLVEHVQGAFVAGSNGGENYPRLAFETYNRV